MQPTPADLAPRAPAAAPRPEGAPPEPAPAYRFALLGLSESGKTCLLAALALARDPHPLGYTCAWVEEPSPAQAGDPERFRAGRDWLADACRRLRGGGLPRANADLGGPPPRLLYDFAAPGRPPFKAEVVDYSGELVHADANEPLVARLRAALAAADAVLVLAEAPRPGDGAGRGPRGLLRLRQAFAALRDEAGRPLPVALLLTKCDRRGPVPADAAGRGALLADVLGACPEYAGLVDHLRASSARPEDFQGFAVSAFGSARRAAVADGSPGPEELPARAEPLAAVGLEDPFVWAARRRDALDLERLEARSAGRRWWHLLGPRGPAALLAAAGALAGRVPAGSDAARRLGAARHLAKAARRRSWGAAAALAAVTAAVLLAGALGRLGRAREDAARLAYRQAESQARQLLEGRGEEDAALARAEAELLAAAEPGRLPPGLAAGAAGLVQQIKDYRDELRRRRLDEKNGANASWLRDQARALAAARDGPPAAREAALNQVRERHAAGLPEPRAATAELRGRHAALAAEIDAALGEARRQADLADLSGRVHALLRGGRVREAARALLGHPRPEDGSVKALTAHFRAAAAGLVEARVDADCRHELWDRAREYLRREQEGHEVWELLDESGRARLRGLAGKVDEREDRYLYGRLRAQKDRPRLDAYLKGAPLGKMRRAAERFGEYLDVMAGRVEVRYELEVAEIRWRGSGWQASNQLAVWVDGQAAVGWEQQWVTSATGGTSRPEVRWACRGRLTEARRVAVHVWYEGSGIWPQPALHGAGEAAHTALEWHRDGRGRTLGLGPPHEIEALVRVRGLPAEPELPEWGP